MFTQLVRGISIVSIESFYFYFILVGSFCYWLSQTSNVWVKCPLWFPLRSPKNFPLLESLINYTSTFLFLTTILGYLRIKKKRRELIKIFINILWEKCVCMKHISYISVISICWYLILCPSFSLSLSLNDLDIVSLHYINGYYHVSSIHSRYDIIRFLYWGLSLILRFEVTP